MKTKDSSVNLADLHPKMHLILGFLDRWWQANFSYELVITSACDGRHKSDSRHYWGGAIDARTWTTETSGRQVSMSKRTTLAQDLRVALESRFGPHYQVFVESDHFHISFFPKSPVTIGMLV